MIMSEILVYPLYKYENRTVMSSSDFSKDFLSGLEHFCCFCYCVLHLQRRPKL